MRPSDFIIDVFACSMIFSMICCTDKKSETEKPTETNTVFDSSETTPAKQSIRLSIDEAKKIASAFAKSYQPDSLPYEGIGQLKNTPDSVVVSFKTLRTADSATHNRLLTIIFLKLSLDHLRCCHQGFEVRQGKGLDSIADPLLYEFLYSTKFFDVTKWIEFINSGIANHWVQKNPGLKKDPLIRKILDDWKSIEDSISKGLYW